jgi:hypothetical protein
MMKSIARFGTSWRICSPNFAPDDDESLRTVRNGDERVVI